MRNKILSVILSVLLLPLNSFAQSKANYVNRKLGCSDNYPTKKDSCACHTNMFVHNIFDVGTTGSGARDRVILETQRRCMHNTVSKEYSVGPAYQEELLKIPFKLESPSSKNKGNIQAQYLYNKETYNYFVSKGDYNGASKYFTANVQILLTNMITNAWAARNIKNLLEADLLTDDEKEAALTVLNSNLRHIGRCRPGICNFPSSVKIVHELIGACEEDACLLTALHIELLESLIKSGAKSVPVNNAIQTMYNILFREIVEDEDGKEKAKSRKLGNQKSNTIVKIPALMAILNLGGEDNFDDAAKKVLNKNDKDYSYYNTGVIMMIMQRYENMGKFDVIKNVLYNKGNVVANMEANIILGAHPEVLTAQQREDVAKVLHDNYANKTSACDGMVTPNGTLHMSNSGALLGAFPDAKVDAMLKQRMCSSYSKLKSTMLPKRTDLKKENNAQGEEDFCTPCQGNVDKSTALEAQEFITEFLVEEFLDDVVLAVLTAGTSLIGKKFLSAVKYSARVTKRAVKTVDRTLGKAVDKVSSSVKMARKSRKGKLFKLRENSKGKQIIDWVDDATDVSKDANKAGKTFNKADDAAQIAKAEENTAKGIKNVKNTNVTNKIDDTAKTFGNSGNVGNAVGANASAMTGTTHTLPQAEVVGSKPPKIERSTLNSVPSNTMSDKQIAEEMAYRSRVKERSQKLNDEIGKLNNQIRDNEEGLISRFTKKSETEQLKAQRDVLQRQQSINEALSNPNIKVNKTSSGYEAVAKNGKKDVLSKQELDTYVKSLNEEDQARFLNRNSNLDKENILPKQETTSLTKEGQVKSLNNEHEKAHGGPVHHLKTTAKKMAINETALKTKENIDKQKHKIHYYKTTSNAKKTKKVTVKNTESKQIS